MREGTGAYLRRLLHVFCLTFMAGWTVVWGGVAYYVYKFVAEVDPERGAVMYRFASWVWFFPFAAAGIVALLLRPQRPASG